MFTTLKDAFDLALTELDELFQVGHFAERLAPWDRWPGSGYIAHAFAATGYPITLAHAVAIAPFLSFAAAERIENFWADEAAR